MSAKSPVNPLALASSWSDQWGVWSPRAAAASMWLEDEPCLYFRLGLAPETAKQVIPASGYLDYNLRLVPGSVVYKLWTPNVSSVQCQISDIALGHDLFQEPVELNSLYTDFRTGRFSSGFLLPMPHPIVDDGSGSGMLRVQFWGAAGTRVFVCFGGGEVASCPKTF